MKFQFNVNLSDQDYINFNTFLIMRSPYGKKTKAAYRITVVILFCIPIFIFLYYKDFSLKAFICAVPMVIVLLFFQLFLNPVISLLIKGIVKHKINTGKIFYAPSSVIEFYEDSFVGSTPYTKLEHKYSEIERISIVDNTMIYLHFINVMAIMLPLSCFESKEHYDSFFEFIKTKCASIDIY